MSVSNEPEGRAHEARRAESAPARPAPTNAAGLSLLYEDADLVAVDKAAGVTVVPAPTAPAGASLHHALQAQRGERLWVIHRLDRETSGVVLFARSAEAHRRLSLAFEARVVRKTYLAFVSGTLDPPSGCIDVPLHDARKGKARPAIEGEPGAKPAVTDYDVRRVWTGAGWIVALVELRPVTGRHHQLRVHLRARGAPILFDRVYGRGATPDALGEAPCGRLALHALRLETPSAAGGGVMAVEAPLAADLAALGAWLDAGSPDGRKFV